MCGLQHDPGCGTGFQRFLPACRAEAPLVSRFQARKTKFRHRGAEVIPAESRKFQELPGNPYTDRMQTDVLAAGVAATIPEKAGDRIVRARQERFSQNIKFGVHSLILVQTPDQFWISAEIFLLATMK